jgi:hypothetical protein
VSAVRLIHSVGRPDPVFLREDPAPEKIVMSAFDVVLLLWLLLAFPAGLLAGRRNWASVAESRKGGDRA